MGEKHVRLGVDLEKVKDLQGFIGFKNDEALLKEVQRVFKLTRINVTQEHVQYYFLKKKFKAGIALRKEEKQLLKSIGSESKRSKNQKLFEYGMDSIALSGNALIFSANQKTKIQKFNKTLAKKAREEEQKIEQDEDVEEEFKKLQKEVNEEKNENQKVNQNNINNVKNLEEFEALEKDDFGAPEEEPEKAPEAPKEDPYAEQKKEIDDLANDIKGRLESDNRFNRFKNPIVEIANLNKEADSTKVNTAGNLKKLKEGLQGFNDAFKPIEEKAKSEPNKELSGKDYDTLMREWDKLSHLKENHKKLAQTDFEVIDLPDRDKIEKPVKEEKEMPGKNNEKDPKKEAYKVNPNNIIAGQNEVQINAVPKQPVAEQNVENVEQKPEEKVELEKAPKVELGMSGNKEAIKGQNEPVVKQEKKVDPAKLEQAINNLENAQNNFANESNIIVTNHLMKNNTVLNEKEKEILQDKYDEMARSEKELGDLLPEKLDAGNKISIPDLIKNQMRLEEGRLSPQEKMEHYQNILNMKNDKDGDKYSRQLRDYRIKIAEEAGREFDKKHQDPAKLDWFNKTANAIEKVMCAMTKNPLGIGILLVTAINFPLIIIGLLAFTAWKRKRPDPAYQQAWKEQNQRELETKRQQMAKTYNCDPSELSDREVTKALKADYVNDKVMEALDEKLEKDSNKMVDKAAKDYAKKISKGSEKTFGVKTLKDLARKEINPKRGLLDLDTKRERLIKDNINRKEGGFVL